MRTPVLLSIKTLWQWMVNVIHPLFFFEAQKNSSKKMSRFKCYSAELYIQLPLLFFRFRTSSSNTLIRLSESLLGIDFFATNMMMPMITAVNTMKKIIGDNPIRVSI